LAVLAVPRLLMAVPGDPGAPPDHQYPRWLIGWVSGAVFPPWFWIKNTGLFWPLLLLALLSPLALRGRIRLLIAPFSLVFLVANLVKFQPWDWDNSKLLVFWYLASAAMTAKNPSHAGRGKSSAQQRVTMPSTTRLWTWKSGSTPVSPPAVRKATASLLIVQRRHDCRIARMVSRQRK
jgi:hypothetical protein